MQSQHMKVNIKKNEYIISKQINIYKHLITSAFNISFTYFFRFQINPESPIFIHFTYTFSYKQTPSIHNTNTPSVDFVT